MPLQYRNTRTGDIVTLPDDLAGYMAGRPTWELISGNAGGPFIPPTLATADWLTVQNKPTTFPPAPHSHDGDDVANLPQIIASLVASGTMTKADVDTDGLLLASQVRPITAAQVTDFAEAAQDAIAQLLQGASGVTLTYDDVSNKLIVTGGGSASGGGSGTLDPEAARDVIVAALVGSAPIQIAHNDPGDSITISLSSGAMGASLLASTTAAAARTALGLDPLFAQSRRTYYYDAAAFPTTNGWGPVAADDKARTFDSVGYPNALGPETVPAIKTLLTIRDIWEADVDSAAL